MFHPSIHRGQRRKAAILMVVIVLLMLFLVIGIAFVLYAEAQSTAARIYREASVSTEYPAPEDLFGWALGEIIYDAPDDSAGQLSAVRGHGLARNMYGWNYTGNPGPSMQPALLNNGMSSNLTPFGGSGVLHTGNGTRMNTLPPGNLDDATLINHQVFSADAAFFANANATHNPERNINNLYTGGANAPYTYPDLNSTFLAWAVYDPNTQQYTVQLPSYWRGQHTGFGNLAPNNPNWLSNDPSMKYRTLRPRPADQLLPGDPNLNQLLANRQIFPLPASATGDVRNLPGVGPNDSIWIDLGYPVLTLTTGKQVKPMFAILVLDLDGRVNLNLAGNIKEQNFSHGSNQGWGRWEINPKQLMQPTGGVAYQSLFWGNGAGQSGRFCNIPNPLFAVPNWPNETSSTPGFVAKNYGGLDYDGSSQTNAGNPQQIQIPQPNQWTALAKFGNRWQGGSAIERNSHPAMFNPFRINLPGSPGGQQADHLFPISDTVHLVNPDPTFTVGGMQFPLADYSRSEIGTLWLQNLQNPQFPNLRNQITSFSMDVDRMGAEPGLAAPGQGGAGLFTFPQGGTPNEFAFPNGNQFSFNALLAQRANNAITGPVAGLAGQGSDMRPNDWRSFLADIGLVDVNRPLTPFPDRSNPQTSTPYQAGAEQAQFQKAMGERAQLAYDIFTRFCTAVGLPDPNLQVNGQYVLPQALLGAPANDQSSGQPGGLYESYRYLAQLAVNIVDYIDDDDIMTVFRWMQRNDVGNIQRNRYVFGTEMPRLVINEVYGQVQNDPNDPTIPAYIAGNTSDPDTTSTEMNPPNDRAFQNGVLPPPPPNNAAHRAYFASRPYRVNFFVGLHNPQNQDPNLTEQGNARLQFNGNYSVYQVWIRSQVDAAAGLPPAQHNMTAPWNVTGAPISQVANNAHIDIKVMNFGQTDNVPPAPQNQQFGTGQNPSQGFLVLAPGDGSANDWQAQIPYDRAGGAPPPKTASLTVNPANQPYPPGFDPAEWGAFPPANNRQSNQLYDTLPVGSLTDQGFMTIGTNRQYQPSVFLRRLAVPYMPPDENPASPTYNPYITVDYLEHVSIADSVLYGGPGPQDHRRDGVVHNGRPATQRQPLGQIAGRFGAPRVSYGRRQPFSATGVTATQIPQPNETNTIQNTFFMLHGLGVGNPGATLDQPFQWYTHLDRQVVNPMELLEVSGYKPHLLTQTFVTRPAGNVAAINQTHRVPWFNVGNAGYVNPLIPLMGINAAPTTNLGPNDTRLYRLLGVLGARDRTEGMAFGGRVPGKINLNTMTQEVFQALCDAQGGNLFTANDVTNAWNLIVQQRTPNNVPSPGDRPFTNVITTTQPADAQYFPAQFGGSASTVIRDTAPQSGVPLLAGSGQQAAQHPYTQHELLRKIYGNLTTRSNAFAVFITTGFFEVRATPAGRPPVLGGEVDPSLRHRFFAIVDRTNLSVGDPARQVYDPTYINDNPPTVVDVRSQSNRPIHIPFDPVGYIPQGGAPVGTANAAGPWLSGVPAGANQIFATAYLTQNGANYTLVDQIQQNGNPETFTITLNQTILYLDTGLAMERLLVRNVTPVTPPPWIPQGVAYNLGDVVIGGGGTYRCIRGNVSNPAANAPPNGTYWEPINMSAPWYVLQLQPLQSAAPYAPGTSVANHFRGCSLSTQIPGNPGPQTYPIPYWQAPYSNTVIGYQQILK